MGRGGAGVTTAALQTVFVDESGPGRAHQAPGGPARRVTGEEPRDNFLATAARYHSEAIAQAIDTEITATLNAGHERVC